MAVGEDTVGCSSLNSGVLLALWKWHHLETEGTTMPRTSPIKGQRALITTQQTGVPRPCLMHTDSFDLPGVNLYNRAHQTKPD